VRAVREFFKCAEDSYVYRTEIRTCYLAGTTLEGLSRGQPDSLRQDQSSFRPDTNEQLIRTAIVLAVVAAGSQLDR
jgi:hypothetical protein